MRVSILALGLAAGLTGAAGASAQVTPSMTCQVDKEIRAGSAAEPQRIALGLVKALLTGDQAAVDGALTPAAKAALGAGGVDRLVRAVAPEAPYSDIRLAHTYRIEVKSGADPLPPMICGKSLADPDAVMLTMRALPEQYHVE